MQLGGQAVRYMCPRLLIGSRHSQNRCPSTSHGGWLSPGTKTKHASNQSDYDSITILKKSEGDVHTCANASEQAKETFQTCTTSFCLGPCLYGWRLRRRDSTGRLEEFRWSDLITDAEMDHFGPHPVEELLVHSRPQFL